MFILTNWGDILKGKVTCRNTSTVDYCKSSSELLIYSSNFSVLNLYQLISYVHCPLKVSLTGSVCNLIINNINKSNQEIKP